jgi:hypothetical protein
LAGKNSDIEKPKRQPLRDLSFDPDRVTDFQKSVKNIVMISLGGTIIPCRIPADIDTAQRDLQDNDFAGNQKKAISVYTQSLIFAEMVKNMPQTDQSVQDFQAVVSDMTQRSAILVPQPLRDDIPQKIKREFELSP